ncbi:MAG: hypothetical protein LBQ94_00100 [Treponema sp.]|nr:hypothetical protein [Treponema sp.]
MRIKPALLVLLSLAAIRVQGESVRASVVGIQRVSLSRQEGTTLNFSYNSSSVIMIEEGDTRFLRGIEIELTAPQSFLPYHDCLAAVIYDQLNRVPSTGVVNLECRQIGYETLPAKIQTTYQIPLKEGHGLRTSPYATVLTDVVNPSAFPILFRLMPVKAIPSELEKMDIKLTVKPILSDEGALRLTFRYPEGLSNRPLTVYINDVPIRNPAEEQLLKEGDYRLTIQSESYRGQNTRFVIERGKITELRIELQDPRPRIIFEFPENARVYLDNTLLVNPRNPIPVEPGVHEVRFQISDYTIIRTLTVQRGRTYTIALSLGVEITEDNQ